MFVEPNYKRDWNKELPQKTVKSDLTGTFIGFDDVFDHFVKNLKAKSTTQNYPPSNVIQLPEGNQFLLELAVAGFSKEHISVTTENGVLTITGTKVPDIVGTYKSRGIATREFKREFALSDDTVISEVSLKDGMLRIYLNCVVPTRHKKKVYNL